MESRWRVGTDESLALWAIMIRSFTRSHAIRNEAATTASGTHIYTSYYIYLSVKFYNIISIYTKIIYSKVTVLVCKPMHRLQ